MELARQAGMAELATNVLHNVGNVLNSINTSATILGERLQALRLPALIKLAELLEEHRADLGATFTLELPFRPEAGTPERGAVHL